MRIDNVTWAQVQHAVEVIAQNITLKFCSDEKIRVYGVPRGGIPVAALLTPVLCAMGRTAVLAETPAEADVFVDDLVDSGKTRDRYAQQYPDALFFSAFVKTDKEQWLSFPWERATGEQTGAEDVFTRLLQFCGEDVARGGLAETPSRAAKAWAHYTSGYARDPKEVLKVFEDGADGYNELVLVKRIPVYSHCEHHMAPIFGVAHVGYIADGKIVGLSKLSRLVDVFARRLQVQERLTNQIAEALDEHLKPTGVGVVLECRHMCMEARGVCQQGHTTVTSALRGVLRTDTAARAEFMKLIGG